MTAAVEAAAAPRKLFGKLGNGGAHQPLVGTAEGFGEQRRGAWREAMRDQFCGKRRKGAPAHIDHRGRLRIGQRRPVQVLRQLAGDIGPGHELHPARGVAPGRGMPAWAAATQAEVTPGMIS